MTELEFHLQKCSACQKGVPCSIRQRLGGFHPVWGWGR